MLKNEQGQTRGEGDQISEILSEHTFECPHKCYLNQNCHGIIFFAFIGVILKKIYFTRRKTARNFPLDKGLRRILYWYAI